jgi:hypothetical protein
MKKLILLVSLSLALTVLANAQTPRSQTSVDARNQTSASASRANKSVTLNSGTQLAGLLQNTLDARHARVGDQVVLKTTQAVKSNGRIVVSKGSRLIGRVTEVAQRAKDNGESRIGILFDRIEQGSLQTPIVASITSITSAQANANAHNDDVFASDANMSGSSRNTSSTRSSSNGGNGGLLGGVVNSTTSTVGNVVGGTTSAVGNTVNATGAVVGNTANGLGRSLGGIQISQSSSTSVEGSSVLSLQGGNLHLEKGTNFNLVLTQSATIGGRAN